MSENIFFIIYYLSSKSAKYFWVQNTFGVFYSNKEQNMYVYVEIGVWINLMA